MFVLLPLLLCVVPQWKDEFALGLPSSNSSRLFPHPSCRRAEPHDKPTVRGQSRNMSRKLGMAGYNTYELLLVMVQQTPPLLFETKAGNW
mmetsp:Transcript_71423/g.167322  ORF Transcript_71423/g.167322 Transcript_71423/m.167322 type:complete len:90 (-) Transcript_71423:210-479(-)